MLKYLREKLFINLGPTATTDLSRDICRVSGITNHIHYFYSLKSNVMNIDETLTIFCLKVPRVLNIILY